MGAHTDMPFGLFEPCADDCRIENCLIFQWVIDYRWSSHSTCFCTLLFRHGNNSSHEKNEYFVWFSIIQSMWTMFTEHGLWVRIHVALCKAKEINSISHFVVLTHLRFRYQANSTNRTAVVQVFCCLHSQFFLPIFGFPMASTISNSQTHGKQFAQILSVAGRFDECWRFNKSNCNNNNNLMFIYLLSTVLMVFSLSFSS